MDADLTAEVQRRYKGIMNRALELLEAENKVLRAQLQHVRKQVAEMATFRCRDLEYQVKKGDGYSKGDELAPFMSESFLYPLFGKDAARTVLAYFGAIRDSVNVDADDALAFRKLVDAEMELSMSYLLDMVREALPPCPEAPELDRSKAPPYLDIPRALRSKGQQAQVEAWFGSKTDLAYAKKMAEHRAKPVVKAHDYLQKAWGAETRLREAKEAVRQAESRAHVREFFRGEES